MFHVRTVLTACLLLFTAALPSQKSTSTAATWPTYGGDPGGQRYSPATEINKTNLDKLRVAWTFHTHALDTGPAGAFESTPILFRDRLYLTTPYDKVFAIDPATGAEIWKYDPVLDGRKNLGIVTSRGVSSWSNPHPTGAVCDNRIFLGTLDGRLISLDADTGKVCAHFGANGQVDLTQNVDYRNFDDYAVTSPPAVVGNVVVVGSGIEDNLRVDVEKGDVRGFDAETGKLLWTWEPMPWANHQKLRSGAGNTWGVITADPERHLLFLPTSSPSPDYYGGLRLGNNQDANSLVALNSDTGKKVWAFQLVHHDIWDYDVAAQPLLFTFHGNIPAVAVASKTGMVFVFNRVTGQSLFPITERAVPASDVPGEVASPTQPFSSLPPLSPLTLDLSKPLGLTPADDQYCRAEIAGMRNEGVFTPPSLHGTVLFPSNVGGVNWGSMAFDPQTGTIYANTNRLPFRVKLVKGSLLKKGQAKIVFPAIGLLVTLVLLLLAFRFTGGRGAMVVAVCLLGVAFVGFRHRDIVKMKVTGLGWDMGGLYMPHFGKEYGTDTGAPFAMFREPFEHDHTPCSQTPWGAVSALNLNTGQTVFQVPLGSKLQDRKTGNWSVGGPMVTAGGVLFTAAVPEPYIRGFDMATGDEIWKAQLPAPAQATPMTYTYKGKQYLVVAAGGHPGFSPLMTSDSVLAFALP